MPRLKLDIFSTESSASEKGTKEETKPPQEERKAPVAPIRELATSIPEKEESPRFIPVGFTGELSALEDAVYHLRKNGHKLASKSAIIRTLIVMHENELDKVWLERKKWAQPRQGRAQS